jgi:hypothetical protein
VVNLTFGTFIEAYILYFKVFQLLRHSRERLAWFARRCYCRVDSVRARDFHAEPLSEDKTFEFVPLADCVECLCEPLTD